MSKPRHRWPKGLRLAVLDRDGHRCRVRLPVCTGAEGGDRLVHRLTDSERFVEDGVISATEQGLRLSTAVLGLSAMASMGEEWQPDEVTWTGFRTLDMFRGLWDRGPDLSDLLNHSKVRQFLPDDLDSDLLQVMKDFIDAFERQGLQLFDTDDGARQGRHFKELRNALHGTAVPKSDRKRERGHRLRVLRKVGEGSPWIVGDIGRTWWECVLHRPELLDHEW